MTFLNADLKKVMKSHNTNSTIDLIHLVFQILPSNFSQKFAIFFPQNLRKISFNIQKISSLQFFSPKKLSSFLLLSLSFWEAGLNAKILSIGDGLVGWLVGKNETFHFIPLWLSRFFIYFQISLKSTMESIMGPLIYTFCHHGIPSRVWLR